jgi:ABC-type dipeptide/oligopeptide/nickel transport system permease component
MKLTRYFLRRVLGALPVLAIITFATFALVRVIPGGPFDIANGKPVPDEMRAQMEARYGLDQPLLQQFGAYVLNALRGDFGPSLGQTLGQPVSEIIAAKLPISARLGILALLCGYAIGLPLGALSAIHYRGRVDHVISTLAVLGASIPSIVIAPILVLFFVNVLHWPGPDPRAWTQSSVLSWAFISRAIPPIIALGLGIAAGLTRLTRASLLQVLDEDYIRTARAKGARERRVIGIHALKNALIPVATITGPLLAAILTGTFFIEAIFGVPGLGDTFILSVADRDYNLLTGVTILYSTLLILGNILVDVVYVWLDPRIRYD